MIKFRLKQNGFTILEMLIATTVFSVLLLITSTAVVGLSRQYYKGIVQARVQETARLVSQEIASNIKFATNNPRPEVSGSVRSWCISGVRYQYVLGRQLAASDASDPGTVPAVLVRDSNCGTTSPALAAPTAAGATELLGENMRLAALDIVSDPTGRFYTVRVKILSGPDDVMNNPNTANAECRGGTGSQFCGTAEYNISVVKRVGI